MTGVSLGDFAQSFMLQRRGVSLRAELTKLSGEMSTGQVSDVREVLAGNVSFLADMERDLRICLLYTSPSPRDLSTSRMPSSA